MHEPLDERQRPRPERTLARRAVPNRFVTSGNDAPFTRVKSSAGPPPAITRR